MVGVRDEGGGGGGCMKYTEATANTHIEFHSQSKFREWISKQDIVILGIIASCMGPFGGNSSCAT